MAYCGLEDFSAGEKYLNTLFLSQSPFHTAKGLLSFLAVAVILLGSQGRTGQAVEALALALTHPKSPTSWIEKWPLLEQWQKKLETALGSKKYQSAWAQGTKLELEVLIGELKFGGE